MKIATLKNTGRLAKVEKGKILFREGDYGNDMYIILNGVVNIYAGDYGQDCKPLVILKNGDYFGEMALLEDYPRSTTAIAQEECLFLMISKSNFEKAIASDPGFAIKIMQSLSNRLRFQTSRYAELETRYDELLKKESPASSPEPFVEEAEERNLDEGGFKHRLKDFSMLVEEKPQLVFSEDTFLSNFFPGGHILYRVPEPDSYKNFVTETERECPVCKSSFKTLMVRHSRLNLDRIEEDFRMVYKDFDPLWYSIWTCPSCYYADFTEEFSKTSPSYLQEAVLGRRDLLRKIFDAGLKEDRTIDHVLNDYYQAMQTLLQKRDNDMALARLWIRLSWLYKDLGDSALYEKASMQAFYYYFESYFKGGTSTAKEDQQMTYLLGLFFEKFNNPQEARKYFFKAIVKPHGEQRINDMAYDKIQDLKGS